MKHIIDACTQEQLVFVSDTFFKIKQHNFDKKEEAFKAIELLSQVYLHCSDKEKIVEIFKYISDRHSEITFNKFKEEYIDDLILFKEQ